MVRGLRIAVGLFLVVSCDPPGGKRALGGDDCKPRHLAEMEGCRGEDSSFQECRFYFRATGVPEVGWCRSLARSAPGAPASASGCELAAPRSWTRVACSDYGIEGPGNCYACAVGQHEASKTYVYGYNPDCSRGIEQVTCNVDPREASRRLGQSRL